MFKYLKGKALFNYSLEQSARLARSDRKGTVILPVMRALAWLNGSVRQLGKQANVEAVAEEWQRMFPGSTKYFPITEKRDDTVIAEIRVKCPLRDSGDVHACHRMMEYDKAMVKKMGGQFIVLESQSNNGKGVCKVAFRMAGADVFNLCAAHQK